MKFKTFANRMVSKTLAFTFLISFALLAACVTVNVNFPEGTIQKATDDYVKELYRAKEKGKTPSTASPTPATTHFEWGFPAAYAADVSFKVMTPASQAIQQKMASRLDQVLAHKRNGVLGETNDGKLTIKKPDAVKKLLLKQVESLVASENADRTELYAEVLKTNNLKPEKLAQIQKSFAHSFQAESPSGTWVQDDAGTWAQKP